MFSVVPNIVLVPNMTQNAERKHRTQNTNTAHIRLQKVSKFLVYGKEPTLLTEFVIVDRVFPK